MRTARPALKVMAALTAVALMTATACGSNSTAAGNSGSSTPSASGSAAAPTVGSASTSANSKPASPAAMASSASSPAGAAPVKATKLHVWMQGDTLKDINIVALNAEFSKQHPGVTVDLQEQTWTDYSTKVTTGLADTSGAAPDVLELGNTQVAQFAGAGALATLNATDFDNSSTWLNGLKASATYDGKLIAVPYYAGVRVGIYRTDLAKTAGVTPPFNSLDKLQAGAVKLM